MTARGQRDAWTLAADKAAIAEVINEIPHGGEVRVEILYGTLRVLRQGSRYELRCYGTGGGYCWRLETSKSGAVRKIGELTGDEVRARRVRA